MFTTMTTMPVGAAGTPGPSVETTLLKVRTHAKTLVKPIVAQALLLAAHIAMFLYFPDSTGIDVLDQYAALVIHGLLLVGEVWFSVLPVLHWHHSSFEVTDRRIRQRWGILNKHSREIHLDRITQVNEERSLIDRLFRCGTIVVYDAANASAIRFEDVPKFHHVRTTIDEARHAAHTRTAHPAAAPPAGQW